jgi:hypothetical protein
MDDRSRPAIESVKTQGDRCFQVEQGLFCVGVGEMTDDDLTILGEKYGTKICMKDLHEKFMKMFHENFHPNTSNMAII